MKTSWLLPMKVLLLPPLLFLASLVVLDGTLGIAHADSLGPDVVGSKAGVVDLSVGAADWTDLRSDDFLSMTGEDALPDGLRFTGCLLKNTHATQTIFIKYVADGATNGATTNRLRALAGAQVSDPSYGLSTATGASFTDVSVIGSGAATTGFLYCQFVR